MARRRKKRRSSRGGGRNRTMPPRDPVTGLFMSKAQVAALAGEGEDVPDDPAPVPEPTPAPVTRAPQHPVRQVEMLKAESSITENREYSPLERRMRNRARRRGVDA